MSPRTSRIELCPPSPTLPPRTCRFRGLPGVSLLSRLCPCLHGLRPALLLGPVSWAFSLWPHAPEFWGPVCLSGSPSCVSSDGVQRGQGGCRWPPPCPCQPFLAPARLLVSQPAIFLASSYALGSSSQFSLQWSLFRCLLLCPNQDSSQFPPAQKPLLAPHYPQDQDRPQGPGSCPSCPSPPGPRAWHGVEATRGCSGRGLSSARPQPPARNALSSFPRLSRPSGGGPWRISGGRSCCLQPTLRAGMRSLLSDGRSLRPRTVHPSPHGPHHTKDWRRSAECPHQTGHHCISQRDRESLRSGQGECPPSEIRGCALSIRPGTLDSGLNLLHSLEALGGRAGSPH